MPSYLDASFLSDALVQLAARYVNTYNSAQSRCLMLAMLILLAADTRDQRQSEPLQSNFPQAFCQHLLANIEK